MVKQEWDTSFKSKLNHGLVELWSAHIQWTVAQAPITLFLSAESQEGHTDDS